MATHKQSLVNIIFSVMLAAIFLGACGKEKEADTPAAKGDPAAQGAPPAVVAITATKQDVPIFGEWTGQTDASQTVNIKARVDGNLDSASFKEGDYVAAGQVLFQIEKATYTAALQSARADLAKAKAQLAQSQQQVQPKEVKATQEKFDSALARAEKDLTRVKTLTAQGAMSQHDLDVAVDAYKQAKAQVDSQKAVVSDTDLNKKSSIDTAIANVESAKAAVTQAELNLNYTTIKSPLHGIIGKIQVYPGNLVSKLDNSTLATISAVDPIKVDFSVSEAEYLKVAKEFAVTGKAKDNPLELQLADNTIYPFKGRFKLVDRAVDSKTGTITIEALFPNPKAIIRPGEFAKVRTLIDKKQNAIVIPDKCIQDLQGQKTVFTVNPDNKVEQKTITVGVRFKDQVVVDSGLNPGDRVVSEGLQKIVPGMLVAVSLAKAQ